MLDANPNRTVADIAVDLGTSQTRIAVRGRGVVVDQATVVAMQTGRDVMAVGEDARRMLGRSPAGCKVVCPVKDGMVADFEATEHLLKHLLHRIPNRPWKRPRMVVCIPAAATEVERRAVTDAARASGGRDISLLATSLAAAVGSGLAVDEAVGNFIIDIGGGRTEAAVVSLGGVVVSRSIPVAGDALDRAVLDWVRTHHNLMIGVRSAEQLKRRIGNTMQSGSPAEMRVRGRDTHSGGPREVTVTGNEIAQAIRPCIIRIRDAILHTLRDTPPELAGDIVERGALMCGATSALPGLTDVLRDATGLPVLLADNPSHAVANGAAKLLETPALLARTVQAT